MIVAAIAILATRPVQEAPQMTWRPRHTIVAGAFHVHTNRSSDSAGTMDEAIAAAKHAGLQFVVATEHGDGTREPLPPAYHDGVLWIDGVEISTADGHYATAGLPKAPYTLAGDGRDVAEDVRRLGGFGVAAHGDSLKSEAQWRDWDASIDGLEWLNLDSVWREAGAGTLARAAATYWFRAPAALASLGSRPDPSFAHVDALAGRQHTIVVAATDAHGRLVPSYAACFGAFSTRVELDHPLSGDAPTDSTSILEALRAGHHYTSIDALAPATFEFTARRGGDTVTEGDTLAEGAPTTFDIRIAGAANAHSVLLRNGRPVEDTLADSWHHATAGQRGEYRVEVTLPGSPGTPPLPWIVSNPIFIGIPERAPEPQRTDGSALAASPPLAWRGEKDTSSTAEVAALENGVRLRYRMGPGAPHDQFAAAAAQPPSNLGAARGLAFTVQAEGPVRFSVEIRARGDRRWQRSIYADTTPRDVVVSFDEMRPIAPNTDPHPDIAAADAVLLLVGISNTPPGAGGQLSFSDVSLTAK